MAQKVSGRGGVPVEVVGFSMPIKKVLGVGDVQGQEDPPVHWNIIQQSTRIREGLFGTAHPTTGQVEGLRETSAGAGVLSREVDPSDATSIQNYFHKLAYHFYIKADALRIASDCGVVIANNPRTMEVGHPLELLVTQKSRGWTPVDDFLAMVDDHMNRRYNFRIKRLHELDSTAQIDLALTVDNPRDFLAFPDDWQANIDAQRPPVVSEFPTAEEVKAARDWYNSWYARGRVPGLFAEKKAGAEWQGPRTIGGIPITGGKEGKPGKPLFYDI